MARPKKKAAAPAEVKPEEIEAAVAEVDAAFDEMSAPSEEIVEARPVQVVAPEPEPVVEAKPVPALELLLAIDPKKLVDDYLDGHKSKLCTIEFVKENKDKLKSLIHGLLDIQAACLEKLPKEAFSVSTMKSEIHEVKRQYEVLEFQCSRI